ncbi:MAG: carbamoyltransferase C-terminal domain-containing protein [bacterium]|nr:carbamoyltransferase C-terminal domain-containing protein [bacterium]
MSRRRPFTVLGLTGLSVAQHDNSAAIVRDGRILFASSEERFSRVKHDASFPIRTIEAGLKYCRLRWSDIDAVAVGFPPYNLASLVNQYPLELARMGLRIACRNPLVLLRGLLTISAAAFSESASQTKASAVILKRIGKKKIMMVDHHLAHAASAYFTTGKERAIAIVLDGYGATKDGRLLSGGVYLCEDGRIDLLEEIPVEASLGISYTAVTNVLGFTPKDGEGKTMGFAAYGRRRRALLERVRVHGWLDGLLAGRMEWQDVFLATDLGYRLKGLKESAGSRPEDLAFAMQSVLEEEGLKFVRSIHARYGRTRGINDYVAAGGIFLNVKLNKKIRELPFVHSFFIHPNPGDGGTALGAAFIASTPHSVPPAFLETIALGVGYTNREILKTLRSFQGKAIWSCPKNIADVTADLLVQGNVIGWFQGRAEWGPRALGQRSVLADPRNRKTKERINNVLKSRDWFMPFAPAVLEEYAPDLFVDGERSPFMTQTYAVRPKWKRKLAAAIHIDGTARPQTVRRKDNPAYYDVIRAFLKQTGVPAILNTSFNRHGLPIVNSPKDAIEHLLWGCVDVLMIGPYLVRRRT